MYYNQRVGSSELKRLEDQEQTETIIGTVSEIIKWSRYVIRRMYGGFVFRMGDMDNLKKICMALERSHESNRGFYTIHD